MTNRLVTLVLALVACAAGASAEVVLRVLPIASLSIRMSDVVLVRATQRPFNVISGGVVARIGRYMALDSVAEPSL